jgi:ABC-2 type transport system permease protein
MFGSLFLAVGACCNDLREAQNLVMPIMLVMVLPMMALGTILRHPGSEFATVLSLIPPATPMVMLLRQAVPPGVPAWQPVAGAVGTLLTTLVCVWAAGRVFRVGLLMQGKPPKLTDLVKWAIRG